MLEGLKKDINKQRLNAFVLEAVSDDGDDDIKAAFLDDPDMAVVGAENDPEIDKLVEEIPPYDEDNQDIDSDLAQMESFIPETEIR